jgi:predicted secreted protein
MTSQPTVQALRRFAAPTVLAFAAAAAVLPLHAQPQVPVPQNVMTLSASATSEVAMDMLAISFSTTREGADAAAVQAELKRALDAALEQARKVARPGQVDVRTGNFALFPRYAPKGGGISGWQGTAQLQVEGRDMQAISQLAGRIQTLSIARVSHGLSRETRERVEAETTAQAIARFRERAHAQAKLFGFGGFTIREVQVGSDGMSPTIPVMPLRARAMSAAADEALPVEAGKASVTSTVSGSVQMTP